MPRLLCIVALTPVFIELTFSANNSKPIYVDLLSITMDFLSMWDRQIECLFACIGFLTCSYCGEVKMYILGIEVSEFNLIRNQRGK